MSDHKLTAQNTDVNAPGTATGRTQGNSLKLHLIVLWNACIHIVQYEQDRSPGLACLQVMLHVPSGSPAINTGFVELSKFSIC